MISSLLRKVQLASLRSRIAQGKLVCPACGSDPAEMPAEPDDLLRCGSCGTSGSVTQWSDASDAMSGTTLRPGEVLRRPPTGIERLGEPPGECEWRIPASGSSGGLLPFAAIWCLIVVAVSGAFAAVFLTGGEIEGDLPKWLIVPFFGIFWAVGGGMLYAGLRAKLASHVLTVGISQISLRTTFLGRQSEKSISRDGLRRAEKVSFHQQNDRPVYGIELKSGSAKLRFGSSLTNDEKDWLVQDINAVVAPRPDGGGAAGAREWQRQFSLPLPTSGAHLLKIGIVITVMAVIMATVGAFIFDAEGPSSDSDAPGLVRVFDFVFNLAESGFRIIWLGVTACLAGVGMFLTARALRNRHRQVRLEGDESQIYLRTYQHERILDERAFPRASVGRLRSFHSGSSNATLMKGMELQADGKALKLVSWVPAAEVDAFVDEASAAIGIYET